MKIDWRDHKVPRAKILHAGGKAEVEHLVTLDLSTGVGVAQALDKKGRPRVDANSYIIYERVELSFPIEVQFDGGHRVVASGPGFGAEQESS